MPKYLMDLDQFVVASLIFSLGVRRIDFVRESYRRSFRWVDFYSPLIEPRLN